MQYKKLEIPDLILLEPKVFHDERGFFFEVFNKEKIKKDLNLDLNFVQDNQSFSKKGVLRGLHYQRDPKGQGKLIKVLRGSIFDVAVDIRKDSKTFGKWVGEYLSAENKKQLWIPVGFAHGFLALEDGTEMQYKVTNYYDKELEGSVLWSDPKINIKWPVLPDIKNFIISAKDNDAPYLDQLVQACL